MIVKVFKFKTDNLIDPDQIAWAGYFEGNAVIWAKVIKNQETTKVVLPKGFRKGIRAHLISYKPGEWEKIADYLLQCFIVHNAGQSVPTQS